MNEHCQGCDEPRQEIRTFLHVYTAKGTIGAGLARWCPECARLAALNYTGDTLTTFGPFKPEGTGGNCTALVATDERGGEWLITTHHDPTTPEPGGPFLASYVATPEDHNEPERYIRGTVPADFPSHALEV